MSTAADELRQEEELNAAFVAPARAFRGQPLAPYTEGSRLLCLQVRDDADSSLWFVWSFLYMHILLAQDRPAALRLAWDRDAFRARLLEWVADKNDQDRLTAGELVGAILDEAARGRVEVIPQALQAPPGNA